MKFKVGDIIKGIDKNRYSRTNTDMTRGAVTEVYENTKDGCDIEVKILEHTDPDEIGELYIVESKYFELVEHAPFGKPDLKTGWRVFTRGGDELVVMKGTERGDIAVSVNHRLRWYDLDNYKDDLTMDIHKNLDIVSVYAPEYTFDMLSNFDEERFKLVWKREEEPIEITIGEIAEIKGVSPERIRIRED